MVRALRLRLRREIRQPNLVRVMEHRVFFIILKVYWRHRGVPAPPRKHAVRGDDDGEDAHDAEECEAPILLCVSRREGCEVEEESESEGRVGPGRERLRESLVFIRTELGEPNGTSVPGEGRGCRSGPVAGWQGGRTAGDCQLKRK